MKPVAICLFIASGLILSTSLLVAQPPAKAVTVPVTLDHNRIVIDVYVPLKDGTTKRVRGLVDTGSSSLMLSERLAKLAGGTFICSGQRCSVMDIPSEIQIGGLKIPLTTAGPARMSQRVGGETDVMIPGMSPEILIPSSVLKGYDLIIDYGSRQFTIGPPGSLKFSGTRVPVQVSTEGLITISGQVNGRTSNFGLDTGLAASITDSAHLADWHKSQPTWPYTRGILGASNMTGEPDEVKGAMLRVPAFQLAGMSVPDVIVASNDKAVADFDNQTPKLLVALLGGEAFKNASLGVDYAHTAVFVQQLNMPPIDGLDVIGLTLRPEVDGRYTVVAIVPYEGQPSVADVKAGDVLVGVDGAPVTGATMGQVWSLLGGEPGQARKLIIERDGKRLTVEATVRRFLAAKSN